MPEPDEPSGLERHIRPYLTDMALWPVSLVLAVVLASFGAALLLMAFRTRNLFAVAALLVLAVATAEAVRADLRRGRLGIASGVLLGLWLLAAALALLAGRLGVL